MMEVLVAAGPLEVLVQVLKLGNLAYSFPGTVGVLQRAVPLLASD